MTLKFLLSISLFLSVAVYPAKTAPLDSLGIRKEGNIAYIIHRVDQGETVYSLSHRYHISQEELIRENPSIRDGLKIGDELKIPLKSQPSGAESNTVMHTVQPSETLFSIARTYGVSVTDIRKWNNLTGNNIAIGQKLKIEGGSNPEERSDAAVPETTGKIHIVNKGETIYSIARSYNVSVDDIKKWNELTSNGIWIGQELIVNKNDQPEENEKMVIANDLKVTDQPAGNTGVKQKEVRPAVEIKPEKRIEKEGDFKKIVERGMAEVIEGSETTRKYLAMHRTAPIGTIMQVKNEMNNLTVFVRVIGKLPDTGDNANVTIRISKTAYDRLGALDKRFPVEISYIP